MSARALGHHGDTMPAAIPDDERQAIIDLFDTGMSCTAIAKHSGRSKNTVGRIAAQVGHEWGRANLVRACEAARMFSAERRAEMASLAILRAMEMLEDFWNPEQVVVPGGKNAGEVIEVKPDARAQADKMKAIQSAATVVMQVSKHDVKPDEGGEIPMLVKLVDSIRNDAPQSETD